MFLSPVIPWAVEGIYPNGSEPWSKQSLTTAPVTDYFTPNTKPPAQTFNYLFAGIAVQSSLLQEFALSALENWGAEFERNSSYSPNAVAWDPFLNYYMLLDFDGTTVDLSFTKGLDGASLWTTLSSITASPDAPVYGACCIDPTLAGQYYVAYTDTAKNLYVWQYASSSWTDVYDTHAPAPDSLYGVELQALGTGAEAFICVAFASTDANSGIIYSQAGAWPGPSVWPPAVNFQSFGITAMNAGDTVYMRSNGSQILCVPSTTASGGYGTWQTTNGSTWTNSGLLAAIAPSGGRVVGLTWTQDAVGLCWLVAVQPSSGAPKFFRSPDGIVWTAQQGGISATVKIADMNASGSHIFCSLLDASSTVPATLPGGIFSVDGGVTWYPSQFTFSSNTSSSGSNFNHNRTRVGSSSIGFIAANGIWCRVSRFAGLPAAAL